MLPGGGGWPVMLVVTFKVFVVVVSGSQVPPLEMMHVFLCVCAGAYVVSFARVMLVML